VTLNATNANCRKTVNASTENNFLKFTQATQALTDHKVVVVASALRLRNWLETAP